LPEYICQP